MTYDAIVFDNDGVLVEPPAEDVLVAAARDAFAEVGVESPDEHHVEAMVRGVTPDRLREVCDAYDLDPATFWRARDRTAAAAQRRELRAGRTATYDDVTALASLDRPFGVVSTNQHETVEFVLDRFELPEFETYYGRPPTIESLRRKKPNPHYLDAALADLGVSDALFVGDSESDVLAAANTGVDSAFVRRPHREGYALDAEPTHEIAGLDELPALVR
ncbi:HAD family hydrolase [halophilic archaeon]|nr:HAD family hydrolase [halophilic archaeon]